MPPPVLEFPLSIPNVIPLFTVDIHGELEQTPFTVEILLVSRSRRGYFIRLIPAVRHVLNIPIYVWCVLISKDLKHIQLLRSTITAWNSAVSSAIAVSFSVPDIVPDRESLFRLCLHLHAAAAAKCDPPQPTNDVLSRYSRRGLPQYVTTSAPVGFDHVLKRLVLPVLRLWTGYR